MVFARAKSLFAVSLVLEADLFLYMNSVFWKDWIHSKNTFMRSSCDSVELARLEELILERRVVFGAE